ncbi:hypothetical protein SD70_04970 [Gordoniibacillus kamchatkensis]|uniref:Uncharacterized protein n=1 Tax=Gordoniibacillus kamchatkensis TaxID=1590651 RepID=A0ABR5AMG6_9BACL|nr:hypothetical protein [Paenibacillus sp. VKM B-2647]KIL41725.1 hypothetical protein SD70_04970 [Paenibacillus sp. VKM B-2647]
MSHFWLTPVTTAPFVVLGDERVQAESGAAEAFRKRLHAVHPWLLPLFKARLLAGESEAAHGGSACGAADGSIPSLAVSGPIIFGSGHHTLSHCGEAFFERLLAPADALALASSLAGALAGRERTWLDAMCRWWRQERFVVLFGE